MISIVVPAHNEAAVIERNLQLLVDGTEGAAVEILVVCNGCTDGTAEAARSVGGPITVVEIEEASKIRALNVADEVLVTFPRVYVDADVELDSRSLFMLVAPLLSSESDLALPRSAYVVDESGPFVRSYLRFWSMLPQVVAVSAGSGVYALSAAGRARFGRWPDTTNDDAFVRAVCADASVIVHDARSRVQAPRSLRALVRRKARVAHGNRQLGHAGRPDAVHHWLGWICVLKSRPQMLLDLPAYLLVTLLSRAMTVRRGAPRWSQDETSRLAPTS